MVPVLQPPLIPLHEEEEEEEATASSALGDSFSSCQL